METAVNLFSYLHDLFLLQCLTHLNQFRRMSLQDGLVHITGIRQAHDDVPLRLLGKHLVGLGHIHLLCQLGRVVPVGHS